MNTSQMLDKLKVLADAAKYDVSCASSGAKRRHSALSKGIGSTEAMGICHSYTPDGRCVSLLKILLTNFCIYDCQYCVNRSSSNVTRARFTPEEVAFITMEFYKRNYIEGLFLSSGIIRNPDYTMEQLVHVARLLREEHRFNGYIHLKTIPDADELLLNQAGRYADRLSINIELPSAKSLAQLAPEKDAVAIERSMGKLKEKIEEGKDESKEGSKVGGKEGGKAHSQRRFATGGQSTQMIIGADGAPDNEILSTSQRLYSKHRLKRVYYSAFSPIPDASKHLPPSAPPLLREHRLYQADWLLRFYGFDVSEIAAGTEKGMLDLDVDPKLAWALKHREHFPLDVNKATKEWLLRVPGLGVRNVHRILSVRRHQKLRWADLARLRVSLDKVRPFVITADDRHHQHQLDSLHLRQELLRKPRQMSLFEI